MLGSRISWRRIQESRKLKNVTRLSKRGTNFKLKAAGNSAKYFFPESNKREVAINSERKREVLVFEARAPNICLKPARWREIKTIIFSEVWQSAFKRNEKGHIFPSDASWGITKETPRTTRLIKIIAAMNFFVAFRIVF